jgi:hypothetical protein
VTNFELQTQNSYLKQSSTQLPENGRRGAEIWEQSAIWSWAAEEISMKIRAFPLGCRPVDQAFLQCWSLVVKKLHRTVAVNFEKYGRTASCLQSAVRRKFDKLNIFGRRKLSVSHRITGMPKFVGRMQVLKGPS